jgi:hypothetical protein
MDRQQLAQTGPALGDSKGASQAAQAGESVAASTASSTLERARPIDAPALSLTDRPTV